MKEMKIEFKEILKQVKENCGFSVSSAIFGILAFVFIWSSGLAWIFLILAIVFGSLGLNKIAKDKNLKGKGLSILGIVLGVMVAVSSFSLVTEESSTVTQPKPTQTTYSTEPVKEYVSYSPSQLLSLWKSYTDEKKKLVWKQNLKGKYVQWEAYVENIDVGSGYDMLGTLTRPTEHTSDTIVGVEFLNSEYPKLSQFNRGDLIRFEGRLDSYGNLIDDNMFYVEDAILLNAKDIIPTELGKHSTEWCLAKVQEIGDDCRYKNLYDDEFYYQCSDITYVYEDTSKNSPLPKTRTIAQLLALMKEADSYERNKRYDALYPFIEDDVRDTYPLQPNDPYESSIGNNCFVWYNKQTGEWQRTYVDPKEFIK